jgi:Uma2 family endonuclease
LKLIFSEIDDTIDIKNNRRLVFMETTLSKYWTYDDYLKIIDDKQYQIINGELSINASLLPKQQMIISNLGYILLDFVKKNNLGKIIFSPCDVILDKNNIVQPDILFISNKNKNNIQEKGIFGNPDIVIEIISPSSFKRDTEDKRETYQKFGIKEYWLVFPLEETIEILELIEGKYKVFDYASIEDITKEQKVKSKLVEGLEINLNEVFFKED